MQKSGGGPSKRPNKNDGPSTPTILENKEERSQQFDQLKELLKKNQQMAVTQEKANELANTLTKMNARVKKGHVRDDGRVSMLKNPSSEKVLLLKQQMEENRVKLAERGKNQKGIEDMVTQIKAQLDDSQQLINQTPLNISLIDDRVDYSPQTSSQELYNILLNKDKRINELHGKVSKLEVSVIDLQENVKEKDSVIDARTKAITLMSENLSKKGKSTLDTLDETKEQMRRMQESFIEMEEAMKLENGRLLNELERKNMELYRVQEDTERNYKVQNIPDENLLLINQKLSGLQSLCAKLQFTSDLHINTDFDGENRMKNCENQLKCVYELIEHHLKTAEEKSSDNSASEELIKLKQQLDESNKSMIKVKAQQKSKIKEFNKKIEGFKKLGDLNKEVVRLENENSKLNQRIAELEEEKGQLQLNMVDSKDSSNMDELRSLEEKMNQQLVLLTEKDEEILNINQKSRDYEEEIKSLAEKLENLTVLQNAQIKSDLTSVQYEELIEQLEIDKKMLVNEKEALQDENQKLSDNLEVIKKEKCEMTTKLETYMHENMELVDRLEKLSGEKVSSAESIEIVENLTAQEKLELEAYQKCLIDKTIDNMETPELNESVNQLTEETAELLRRIELFTVERREVMDKMEHLTNENNQLNDKIKVIENNRDVLVETYEQLQNEKDDLCKKLNDLEAIKDQLQEKTNVIGAGDEFKELVDIKEQEIRDLRIQLLANVDIKDKLIKLQDDYEILLNENELLKEKSQGSQDESLVQRISDFEAKLKDNLEEIEHYKTLIEENKDELIKSSNVIVDLQEKLKEKDLEVVHYISEVTHLNSVIDNLNTAISQLEEENTANDNVKVMSDQLDELKLALNENLEQAEEYEKELSENSNVIQQLQGDLKGMSGEISELKYSLDAKAKEVAEKDEENSRLEKLLKEKDEEFHSTINELKEKCTSLQGQIEANTGSFGPLEGKVRGLETKNKEQLEKMKKIAANLKKKSNECKELQSKNQEIVEKWEYEMKEKEQLQVKHDEVSINFDNAQKELLNIRDECATLTDFNNQMQEENGKLLQELTMVSNEKQDLENIKREYEHQINSMSNQIELLSANVNKTLNDEMGVKDELINKLNRELEQNRYDMETQTNALRMKINELEMYIETQDNELHKYKEQVGRLEEGLSQVEARRLSLEHRAIQLGAELQVKESTFEEVAQKGGFLEERLAALAEHDRLIEQRLQETLDENRTLQENNQSLINDNENIKKQLNTATRKLQEDDDLSERYNQEREENSKLNDLVKQLESEVKRNCSDLTNLKFDAEKNENELQEQLEQFSIERKVLLEQFEISKENVASLQQQELSLQDSIKNLNMKLDQQQNDYEELLRNHHQLQSDYNKTLSLNEELNGKVNQMQIEKVETSSSDLRNEINELNELVKVKSEALINYQQEFANNPANFFETPQAHPLEKEIENLTRVINEKNEELSKSDDNDTEVLKNKIEAFTREITELKNQLDFSRNMINSLEETNLNVLGRNDDLEKKLLEYQAKGDEKVDEEKSTFAWPEVPNDPFSFVQEPMQQQHVASTSASKKDDLEQKVKTLEFMLYNVEKEKDNLNIQCHDLSNELARLVYDRENKQLSTIESQILSGEEVCIAPSQPLSDLCVQQGDVRQVQENVDNLVEEACMQKSAYLCQGDNAVAFEENDDGWALGKEEAQCEQEHYDRQHSTIAEFEETIRVLNMERENHLEEIKQAQIKSGKLLKKLKEFKVKNEQLEAKLKSDDFGDLNDTIQEELKSQIAGLEKRIKDVSGELDKERLEKDNMLKRIDVLTLANERMVEMKEKQDIEVLSWQQRNRELTTKLQQFEWGDEQHDEVKSTTQPQITSGEDLTVKIEELNDVIKDLTLDNEEMQQLLEEQRQLRLEADKSNKISETDYNNLRTQLLNAEERLKEISQQLQLNYSEKTQLEATILDNNITIESLTQQLNEVAGQFSNDNSQTMIDDLTLQLNNLREEYAQKTELFKQEIKQLDDEKEGLVKQLKNHENELTALNEALSSKQDELNNVNLKYQSTIDHTNEDFAQKLEAVSKLEIEKLELLDQLGKHENELKALNELLSNKEIELNEKDSKYQTTIDELVQEWSQHVEQRGTDVAESWKLHLDARETEFMQLEQQLRKNIYEIEEKYNALVNENNELRKNVDAEIRNEVDRISAFQQQIIDKEQKINEISELLQKKISECDAMKMENEQLKSNLDNFEEEKVNEMNQLNNVVAELKISIKDKEDLISDNIKSIEEFSNKLLSMENLIQSNEKLQKDLQDQSMLLSDYQLKITSMEGDLQEKDKYIYKLSENQMSESQNAITLQQQLHDLQQQINGYNVQLQDYYLQIETLTQEIESYKALNEHLQSKDLEINKLNALIKEKESEYDYNMQSNQSIIYDQTNENEQLKRKLNENDMLHDQQYSAKEIELESYKKQLDSLVQHENDELSKLRAALYANNEKCAEYEALVNEDEKQLNDLKAIIEDQVLKIEELKKELYDKCNDYDTLVAELNTTQELHTPTKHQRRDDVQEASRRLAMQVDDNDDDGAEPVSRAELELALYMLHQRDVRVEELTIELMQLLEERDTLQLRLSNALREKEELRQRDASAIKDSPVKSSSGAIPRTKEIILGATGTELAAEATEQLANKLSELKNVGYRKDKTIVDEQELRRMQQFAILEQHKDELSKLPAEAASRLVDASYTLSRDVQSPSKVLLNWLWGKSTPKVNNI